VRQAVLWAGAQGYTVAAGIGAVGDPAASIMEGAATDGDSEIEDWGQVLRGLAGAVGGDDFQARDVLRLHNQGEGSGEDDLIMIREGLGSILGDRKAMTTTRVGHALKNRRDRIVGGLVLRAQGKARDGAVLWRVVHASG
jgi:hypothetical protein